MRDFRFGRDARIFKTTEYERVIAEGRKFTSVNLLLWLRKREGELSEAPQDALARIGVSVSRKAGGACRRNRLKRLLREAFRLNRHRISADYDLVVYPRPGCRWRSLGDAEEEFLRLCRKAGILREL